VRYLSATIQPIPYTVNLLYFSPSINLRDRPEKASILRSLKKGQVLALLFDGAEVDLCGEDLRLFFAGLCDDLSEWPGYKGVAPEAGSLLQLPTRLMPAT
jgi:hypothetical protein